jgi:diaminopropionate ammonia-lyase family
MDRRRSIFLNHNYQADPSTPVFDTSRVQQFHQQLPGYAPTPLVSLDAIRDELGVKAVFVKNEASRLGLPSFKILGASWATHQAIISLLNLPSDSPLDTVARAAQRHELKLFAATDGNHGRAIAQMAKHLGIPAFIYIPRDVAMSVTHHITSEGAHVTKCKSHYDDAVRTAHAASEATSGGLFIQDGSFEGYEEIPKWVVEGYSTMMVEIKEQLSEQNLTADLIVSPVGVGSLAHAVVTDCHPRLCPVLVVEPDVAACVQASLRSGNLETVETSNTIMEGLNCGTPSLTAFADLKSKVSAAVTVSDLEAHEAVKRLASFGVYCGPCGGAALAGLARFASVEPRPAFLTEDSVVVLLSTEGPREYTVPVEDTQDGPH